MSKQNPSYYAILTADVRYDNDLPPNAKLLFAELTALANTTGVCTASNGWLAKLYDVKPGTISGWITLLAEKGYIQVTVLPDLGNKREITIRQIPDTSTINIADPSTINIAHNNTSNNNIQRDTTTDLQPNVLKGYRLYLKYFIQDEEGIDRIDQEQAMKRYRLTPKRLAALERRLKDCEPKLLFAAIVGFGRADWSNGNNDRRWKADLADFICRSYENVERGARLYEDQRKAPGGEDPWAHL